MDRQGLVNSDPTSPGPVFANKVKLEEFHLCVSHLLNEVDRTRFDSSRWRTRAEEVLGFLDRA